MISRNSSLPEIKQVVKECLNQFYSTDGSILQRNKGNGVSERTIVFRFAHYLQNAISDFFVDCDFNSSFEGYIDLQGQIRGEERQGKPIENEDRTITKRFIDIIVHKRDYNSFQNDFICFEMKKWNNTNKNEFKKDRNNLRVLTSQYGYVYGFHLSVHKIRLQAKWTIFHDGIPIEENVEVFNDEASN